LQEPRVAIFGELSEELREVETWWGRLTIPHAVMFTLKKYSLIISNESQKHTHTHFYT
jgi:hypothetical protein